MRTIDRYQFWWLIVLSVAVSFTAIVLDEIVFKLVGARMAYKESYFIWVGSGIGLVMVA